MAAFSLAWPLAFDDVASSSSDLWTVTWLPFLYCICHRVYFRSFGHRAPAFLHPFLEKRQ